jgi:hypothetical protein
MLAALLRTAMLAGWLSRIAGLFRGTPCSPGPASESAQRRRWLRVAIAFLLVGGWILPSVAPPGGVIWAFTELRKPDLYWRNVYYGNWGFFSKCAVVEDTWEWTHGHTWILGPWIEGYAISMCVPVFGLFLLLAPTSRGCLLIMAYIALACGFARAYLWFLWIAPFAWETTWLTANWILLSVLLLFSAFMLWSCRRNKARPAAERVRIWAADALLFYPAWILALERIQHLWPSIGWFMTVTGCGMLGWRARKNAHERKDPANMIL